MSEKTTYPLGYVKMDMVVDRKEKIIEHLSMENMELDTSILDFHFVCRICLMRGELRLFREEETYLLDLLLNITKIDIRSTVNLPRNVCSECINKLEDISSFIDTSKYNDPNSKKMMSDTVEGGMSRESFEELGEHKEDVSVQKFQFCRICLSMKSLTLFEEKSFLMKLFQTITNIDVETDTNSSYRSSICNKCINELEKISSFINLLFCNDGKLQNAIVTNKAIKVETYSDSNAFDISLFRCGEMKVEINRREKVEKSSAGNSYAYECKDIYTFIDIKEENFDCELVASTEQNYQNRLETKINLQHLPACIGEKPSKCDCCGKTFFKKSVLQRHMLSHTGEKQFECNCCKKRFSRKHHLKEHMVSHTGEKPFKCDVCEKSFGLKGNLKLHMLRHNGEEQQFKCNCCQKGFTEKGDLQLHMITHTEEKPFECDCCTKCFTRKEDLKQHTLTHTGGVTFKCDSCGRTFSRKLYLERHMLTHCCWLQIFTK